MKCCRLVVALIAAISFSRGVLAGNLTTLHSFVGTDGRHPNAGLTLDGATLYGTTEGGGSAFGGGTVFSINTDGSAYRVIHAFHGSDGDGLEAGVTLDGSKLYGTTFASSPAGTFGTVFVVNTDGNGFQTLHQFQGSDGSGPVANLTLAGGALYGTAESGGLSNKGTVFSLNSDGTNFKVLHSFIGSDGSQPTSALAMAGSTLYGTTGGGGALGQGTVFSMNTDGSGFQLLTSTFNGGFDPYAGVIVNGSTLYGAMNSGSGGNSGDSSVFAMNADGSGFHVLHSLSKAEGTSVFMSQLTLNGSKLYGMAEFGGSHLSGTLFSVNTDGTNFQVLYNFDLIDGQYPARGVVIDGSMLFGTTMSGGDSNAGTVFALTVPEPSSIWLLATGVVSSILPLIYRKFGRRDERKRPEAG